MARKKSSTLTDGEHRIMEVVWERGASTVAEVAEVLSGQAGSAYNTVLTMMRILHEKGYLQCHKQGRAHVYQAKVKRDVAARDAVRHLLGKFFDHSPRELVLSFLKDEEFTAKELDALKQRILETQEQEDPR